MNKILKSLIMMGLATLFTQNAASQYVSDNGYSKAYSDRPFNSFSGYIDSATHTNIVVPVEAQSDYCRLRNNGSTQRLGGGVYGYATRVKYNGGLYDAVNIKLRIYYDQVDKAMRAGIRFEDAVSVDTGTRFNAGASLSESGTLTYADGSSIFQDLFNCAEGRLSYGRGTSLRQAETDEATAIRRGLLYQFAVRLNMIAPAAPTAPVAAVVQQSVQPAQRILPIRRLPWKFRFSDR